MVEVFVGNMHSSLLCLSEEENEEVQWKEKLCGRDEWHEAMRSTCTVSSNAMLPGHVKASVVLM